MGKIEKLMMPVIKWSGSKRSQAKYIVDLIKNTGHHYRTYFEPFCGGANVLFFILHNCPDLFERYVASDINADLISLFHEIRKHPKAVYEHYLELWVDLNRDTVIGRKKAFFNSIRNRFNNCHNPYDFMFLMRTTTNGMPRYNKKGEFNNSFHITRNGIDPVRLRHTIFKTSMLLRKYNVDFFRIDYHDIKPDSYDFVYLDPPYQNTRGMYHGKIEYDTLWEFMRQIPCDYFLSFDGIAGQNNMIAHVPEDLYNRHILLNSGNSSFRRVIGKSTNTHVRESLYTRSKV